MELQHHRYERATVSELVLRIHDLLRCQQRNVGSLRLHAPWLPRGGTVDLFCSESRNSGCRTLVAPPFPRSVREGGLPRTSAAFQFVLRLFVRLIRFCASRSTQPFDLVKSGCPTLPAFCAGGWASADVGSFPVRSPCLSGLSDFAHQGRPSLSTR